MNHPSPTQPQHPAFELLLTALESQLAQTLNTLQSPETSAANIRAELTTQLSRLNDDAWNSTYHNAIKFHTPADYAHTLIHHNTHTTLAGIHFQGGDAQLPFVHINATTADPTTSEIYNQARAALDAYSIFNTTRARILSPTQPPDHADWSAEPDQHTLAARVSTVAETDHSLRVTLHPIEPADGIAFITPVYDHLAKTRPHLAHRIPMADLEGLEGCDTDGTLHTWHIDSEPAGLIATQRMTNNSITGSLMWELAALPEHRGKRSAAAAQIALAGRLAEFHGPDHVLFGEIDAANTPSLKTARSVGRVPVTTLYWLTPM